MVARFLTDDAWRAVAPVLPGKSGDPGCRGRDNRLFLEAVLWVARSRAPWRGLPPEFGKWYTAYTRFRRWEKNGVWPKVIEAMRTHDPDCPYYYDSTKGMCWTPPAARPIKMQIARAVA